jgi:hypothetical protein
MCQESLGFAFFNHRARRAERLFNQLIYLIIFIHSSIFFLLDIDVSDLRAPSMASSIP